MLSGFLLTHPIIILLSHIRGCSSCVHCAKRFSSLSSNNRTLCCLLSPLCYFSSIRASLFKSHGNKYHVCFGNTVISLKCFFFKNLLDLGNIHLVEADKKIIISIKMEHKLLFYFISFLEQSYDYVASR